jgi:hemoglobin/transferrin/lactoferrin receptor protein
MGFLNQNLSKYFIKSSAKQWLFFVGIMLLSIGHLHGQSITVIDAFTQRPLEEVMVVNQNKKRYSSSDIRGKIDLEQFVASDLLTFQLMGYEALTLSLEEIKGRGNVIDLFLDEKQLEEIVLSVARTAEQSRKIAEKVAVINQKSIVNQSPTTGADLLILAPSVRLQKSQGGGGSPVLRGFEANRVLLVVDGVRLNNAIYRSGHLQNAITVDPNSIERVEVIYGSSSVGYGSDALGGVVHYYTKTPKINNIQTLMNAFSSTYNSAQNTFISHVETEASFKKWASYTSLTYSSFGDLKMGENRQHAFTDWGLVPAYSRNNETNYYAQPSFNPDPHLQKNVGYTQFDFLEKVVINLPKASQLLLNFQLSNSSNIPRFDKLNEYVAGSLRFAEWFYGPQKRALFSPQLKLFPKNKFLYKGTITAAYQALEESRIQRKFNSLSHETQEEKVKVLSINGDFELAKKERSSIAYGFELVSNRIVSTAIAKDLVLSGNKITSFNNFRPIPTRYPSDGSQYNTAALYGNFRLDFSPKTTFSLGGRFTTTHLKANWKEAALIDANLNKINVKNNALTGSFSVSYRPKTPWRINLLFSSGFRSPNVDDLGKIRENKGILLVPNTDLKPEYVYNIDGGIAYIPTQKNMHFNLRFYHTSLRDYIGRMAYEVTADQTTLAPATVEFSNDIVTTQANNNIGNGRVHGLSFEGGLKLLEGLDLNGNFTYTHAARNEMIGALPSILPFYGGAVLGYKKDSFNLNLNYTFNSQKKPEDYSSGGEDGLEETPLLATVDNQAVFAGTPKWSIFSLRGNYQLNKSVLLNVAVENIFDLHYRTFASGISAPGRSLILGTRVNF